MPAYRECETPNRMHGPPLAFGSCAPPAPAANALTVGTPHANGQEARSEVSVTFDTIVGNPATLADEADVRVTVRFTHVRRALDLTDYTGHLRCPLVVRLTDRFNGCCDVGGPHSRTLTDALAEELLTFGAPCAATADPAERATCSASTSANVIAPRSVRRRRSESSARSTSILRVLLRRKGSLSRSDIQSYVITYAPWRQLRPDRSRSARAIRALREAMDLSLRDLAERSGVSAPMLSQVERGETSPTLAVAAKIAAGLELTPLAAAAPRRGRRRHRRARRRAPRGRPRGRPPLRGADAAAARASAPRSPCTRSRPAPPPAAPTTRRSTSRAAARPPSSLKGAVRLVCDGVAHDLERGRRGHVRRRPAAPLRESRAAARRSSCR